MERSMLWEAFQSLSTAEVREFDKFVRSPFFNTRPQVLSLLEYLMECREQQHAPALKGAGVEQRLLHSALLSLLEQYLIYQEMMPDRKQGKIALAAAYRKRKLTKHFQIALREARRQTENLPWRHADYFQEHYLLDWEQYQFDSTERRTDALNLQSTSDWMDQAFLTRKLRLACLAVSHQNVYRAEYRLGLLPEILQHVETTGLIQTPAIGLYFHGYRFLTEPFETGAGHFEQYRAMLDAHAQAFPEAELRALYLLAINFGIKKLNEAREGWLRTTFDLYQSALARDLLVEHNQISRFAFNNMVAIALRVGEIDWAEQFILQYKPKLERHWRDATASLNLARVAYARKDYKTALLHLQRSDYKDLINNLIAKTLQLKIYYETDSFDLLSSHLASMRNFIRRHTAIGYHRTNYTHLLDYTQRLIQLNMNHPKAVAALRERIVSEKILTEKDWFLEMLDQK